jgi:hypothetical protein
MPQFFIMGNNLRHYFCYIVSNLRWQYPHSFVNVTFLVIYPYNRWIYAVSAHPAVPYRRQDGLVKAPKLL